MINPRDFTCAECGVTFQAKRETATYCSPTCRRRASRARGGQQVEPSQPPTVPPAAVPEAPTANQPIPDPPLVTAVVAELAEAGKLETRQGQQAVVMARKMANANTSPSSVASLSKALDDMMDRLCGAQGGSGPAPAGRRGTLATRRQAKRGAAA